MKHQPIHKTDGDIPYGNPSFNVCELPAEHNAQRTVLGDLLKKRIAPYAADADEDARFQAPCAGIG
ncbi:MAG: hypothetical protein QOD88_2218 [Mycobacterium sp.]|jgi:hypothetical protein|nr:hypothetical protein [Mycobacterium sp.]MDT5319696.1 hypothetical protein [Mycobacterium sp.]